MTLLVVIVYKRTDVMMIARQPYKFLIDKQLAQFGLFKEVAAWAKERLISFYAQIL